MLIDANKKASAEKAGVTQSIRPTFTKPVFNIKSAKVSRQNSSTSPQSRILTRDVTVEIDLKSAPLKTLLEVPGVDEALAETILTTRDTCKTVDEFKKKTRGSVFSKKKGRNGIRF